MKLDKVTPLETDLHRVLTPNICEICRFANPSLYIGVTSKKKLHDFKIIFRNQKFTFGKS